tara:strand:+ start:70 stop:480 length:411 start_codon:yes stop_codon:yes gene_type:complete
MAKVSPAKKQHRSMRGKTVDMDLLRKRNELTPAVGNARVNARGDELGPGGKIIKRREEIVKEHYAVAGQVRSGTDRSKPVADEPIVTSEVKKTTTRTKKETPVVIEEPLTTAEQELLDDDSEWVEDESGNFIQKGV